MGLNTHRQRGGTIAVIVIGGQVSAPIFILVPQVKLRKRLDLARVAGAVPGLVVEN